MRREIGCNLARRHYVCVDQISQTGGTWDPSPDPTPRDVYDTSRCRASRTCPLAFPEYCTAGGPLYLFRAITVLCEALPCARGAPLPSFCSVPPRAAIAAEDPLSRPLVARSAAWPSSPSPRPSESPHGTAEASLDPFGSAVPFSRPGLRFRPASGVGIVAVPCRVCRPPSSRCFPVRIPLVPSSSPLGSSWILGRMMALAMMPFLDAGAAPRAASFRSVRSWERMGSEMGKGKEREEMGIPEAKNPGTVWLGVDRT